MPTVTLDKSPAGIQGSPRTLGELLGLIDERLAGQGRIVTAVRLDGVDEPAFREAAVTARALASLARIDVESGTPIDLACTCLGETGAALDTLAQVALDAAHAYRNGLVADANRDVAAVSNGIGSVLAIVSGASVGVGLDLMSMQTDEGSLGEVTVDITQALQSLIDAHQGAHWHASADLLEYALAPALRRWRRVSESVISNLADRGKSSPSIPAGRDTVPDTDL